MGQLGKQRVGVAAWLAAWSLLGFASAQAAEPPLADYFRAQTRQIAARPLLGIESPEQWKAARLVLQQRLRAMLGLDPMPERGDLHARVTGQVDRPDFVVEKLVYQSSPGLYVTGNLYRPKAAEGRLPAILYVCGHSKVEKDGVRYGNKTHYQHHAAWYAANGYVCLVLDTLELGELPGLHHGTYQEGMWWWQSRGYTPAGIEAWNAIRGIDYLCSRPDVDPAHLGVTGRSGGGATSWWVGALDDRVAAVVPVAGITDLQNHVVDGVVEGHCDCMYTVNTDRWDYTVIAALVAPRPMLVENTDKDPIFPEDGVRRIYGQLEKVYAWYGASDRLGLVIGRGGHKDTTEIRHPSFAFFDKWLKGKEASIDEPDRRVPIEDLKVLKPGETPEDSKNATIHESFVAKAVAPEVPRSREDWSALRSRWLEALRSQVFAGWPAEGQTDALDASRAVNLTRDGVRLRAYDFTSQQGVRLRLWLLDAADRSDLTRVTLTVADERAWKDEWSGLIAGLTAESGQSNDLTRRPALRASLQNGQAVAVLAPRGIGPTAWPASKDTQVRRRFALLGQTLDGMRAWDVRRALAVLHTVPDLTGVRDWQLAGSRSAATWTLWAAVFEPGVKSVALIAPPATVRDGPAFLNLERVLDMPQAVGLLFPRPVILSDTPQDAWRWTSDLGRTLDPAQAWPRFDRSGG